MINLSEIDNYQSIDDQSQSWQTFVDIISFFESIPRSPCLFLSFWTSQIHKI